MKTSIINGSEVSRLSVAIHSERLGITQQTYARLEANPASAGFERLFRVFSVLGVEIVLSSREPLSDAKPEYGAMHNYSSLPARREKW